MDTFAFDLAPRTAISTDATSASSCRSPSIAGSPAVGQGERWMDEPWVQDQVSSVTNGRNGANNRSCTSRAMARADCAEACASGPWEP